MKGKPTLQGTIQQLIPGLYAAWLSEVVGSEPDYSGSKSSSMTYSLWLWCWHRKFATDAEHLSMSLLSMPNCNHPLTLSSFCSPSHTIKLVKVPTVTYSWRRWAGLFAACDKRCCDSGPRFFTCGRAHCVSNCHLDLLPARRMWRQRNQSYHADLPALCCTVNSRLSCLDPSSLVMCQLPHLWRQPGCWHN